jgi:hypothetical protein
VHGEAKDATIHCSLKGKGSAQAVREHEADVGLAWDRTSTAAYSLMKRIILKLVATGLMKAFANAIGLWMLGLSPGVVNFVKT